MRNIPWYHYGMNMSGFREEFPEVFASILRAYMRNIKKYRPCSWVCRCGLIIPFRERGAWNRTCPECGGPCRSNYMKAYSQQVSRKNRKEKAPVRSQEAVSEGVRG